MKTDHPAYWQECCGAPFVRTMPSGRTQHFHRFWCETSPNQVIDPVVPRRAEMAKARRDPDDGYTDYWSDRAFEQQGGR